jgi:DNA-binding response OmpR family regulator
MIVEALPGSVLIVDDEANIREGLRAVLGKAGHKIRSAESAETALRELTAQPAEAVILDIQMPGMSGIELLAIIKERWPHTAVILLTGQGTLETAMTAVRQNAFDYLLKPAQPEAIRDALARALADGRRQRQQAALLDNLRDGLRQLEADAPAPPPAPVHLRLGDITIDPASREVERDGEPISLTPTEYKLLLTLIERNGAVVGYVALTREVLAYAAELPEAKELIKRHIFTLRQKIEADPSRPVLIVNARGVGYRAGVNP